MEVRLGQDGKLWTLTLEDSRWVVSKPLKAQLDYAIRLLVYREKGTFITTANIDQAVFDYVSEQLAIPERFQNVPDMAVRTSRLRAMEVLSYLKIRPSSAEDRATLKTRLLQDDDIFRDYETFEKAVQQWCVGHGVTAPTQTWLGRTFTARLSKLDDAAFRAEARSLSEKSKTMLLASISGAGSDPSLLEMRGHPGRISKANFDMSVRRLDFVKRLGMPERTILRDPSWQKRIVRRVNATRPNAIKQLKRHHQIGLYATFLRDLESGLVDGLVEALCDAIKKFNRLAKKRIDADVAKHAEQVREREEILRDLLDLALREPERQLGRTVSLRVGKAKALQIIRSIDLAGGYHEAILVQLKKSWFGYYRPMLTKLFQLIKLDGHSPSLMRALNWISVEYDGPIPSLSEKPSRQIDYLTKKQESLIWSAGEFDREAFEVYTIIALMTALDLRKIWVEGSQKYRDPALDVPADFSARRLHYYDNLQQPLNPRGFTARVKRDLEQETQRLNETLPTNRSVFVSEEKKWNVRRYQPLPETEQVRAVKADLFQTWKNTEYINVLKETALDTGFLRQFRTFVTRSALPRAVVDERLLLCLFGLGTNVGLSAIASAAEQVTDDQLRYIKDTYIDKDALIAANKVLSNSILSIRDEAIWGPAGVGCASDSKQYAAWDRNPMAEMHLRYGRSGIMVYWHVERRSLCFFSKVKRVSTPEVAPMLHGILHHGLNMNVQRHFTDSHGQTEVGFGFCHLLGFDLAPRIKRIAHQTLFLANESDRMKLGNISTMCRRQINWRLIEDNYDELIQYATALKEGAETAPIMRLFRRGNEQNPYYRAMAELGRAVKTIYVCRYLRSEALRRDVQEGLNVMENWNSATKFTYFGRGGAFTSNSTEDMEVSAQALRLLQNSLVYVNTRMYQSILERPDWKGRLSANDLSRISPLIREHINIMGKVSLRMNERLAF